MLLVLVGCHGTGSGADKGPLTLPSGLEVSIADRGTCDAPGASHDEGEAQGEIVSPDGPRLVHLEFPGEDPDGVRVYDDFPYRQDHSDTGTTALDGSNAELGQGESVIVEVGAKLYCEGGSLPKAGGYRRSAEVTSTDVLGGDPVTQQLEVLVRIE